MKGREMIKEVIISLVIGALFGLMIVLCAQKEDRLIQTHCSHLTGYEYGQCQASLLK